MRKFRTSFVRKEALSAGEIVIFGAHKPRQHTLKTDAPKSSRCLIEFWPRGIIGKFFLEIVTFGGHKPRIAYIEKPMHSKAVVFDANFDPEA